MLTYLHNHIKGAIQMDRPFSLEEVSKPPLGRNLGVGLNRPILEIFPIFLRLAASARLDLESD